MGTVTAGALLDKATTQLVDLTNVRWTRAELLKWLNDGMRQIVLMQPNATNTVASIKLDAGTRQNIPANGWLLLNVVRNMGTTGDVPGRAIRIISRELLNAFNPDWHTDTAAAVTKNFIYDLADQTHFFVYPPSTGTGYVEINYSMQPVDLTSESQAIPIFDVYQGALVDYMLYRACSKDAEYAPGLQLAQGYAATFIAAIQGKETSEVKSTPEQAMLPRNPSMGGSDS
jgi:hypothetical protein